MSLDQDWLWPAVIGFASGLVLTVATLWNRVRSAGRPTAPPQDLLCEAGQMSAPAAPGMPAVVFPAPSVSLDLGTEQGNSTAQLVCTLDESHRVALSPLAWTRDAIVFLYPEKGPCPHHPQGTWYLRVEITVHGTVHSTGPVLVAHPEGQGYATYPQLPTSRVVELTDPAPVS